MSITYKLRRSALGKCARQMHHAFFRLRHAANHPVEYRLPLGIPIRLYPEGEIAAFLSLKTSFEVTELQLVAAYLKEGMEVVDVGANIGLYSILAQKRVGKSGKVWAFEPSLQTFERLRRNLPLNSCEQVTPIRLALADKTDAVLDLTSDKGFGDAYRYLKYKPQAGQLDSSAEAVPVTTLDSWASENGIDKLDFLKVDIEGGEYPMFQGSRNILQASRNIVVFFESDEQWCERAGFKRQQTFDLLQELGLGLYAWDRSGYSWRTENAFLLASEMIWACFERERLPVLNQQR